MGKIEKRAAEWCRKNNILRREDFITYECCKLAYLAGYKSGLKNKNV